MQFGPLSLAYFTANSFGTLSAEFCVTLEAFTPPSAAIFVSVIVKVPIVQMLAMALALFILAVELPLPIMKSFSFYRSFVVRVVLLLFQVFLTILFYQGTNAAIWSLIAAFGYSRAISNGEQMKEAKQNRGKGGVA